jgi:hypothetical protein
MACRPECNCLKETHYPLMWLYEWCHDSNEKCHYFLPKTDTGQSSHQITVATVSVMCVLQHVSADWERRLSLFELFNKTKNEYREWNYVVDEVTNRIIMTSDFRFSLWWLWTVLSSQIQSHGVACFMPGSCFAHTLCKWYVPLKFWFTFRLNGIMCHKIGLLKWSI